MKIYKMKKILVLMYLLPIFGIAQSDTLFMKSDDILIKLPIKENNYVVYEFIENIDTTLSDETIYQNLKSTLSVITKQTSIGLNNPIFKVYGGDPLLFDDKDSKHFIFQLSFRTVKKEDESDNIIPNLVYFTKADIRIKNHRIKFVLKDIDCYFQSKGAVFLVGAANSVFKYDFNGFPTNENGENSKIVNNVYETNNYMAKRIYTVDYKIKNMLIPFIVSEMYKTIKDSNF
jgi:hypothetical protein